MCALGTGIIIISRVNSDKVVSEIGKHKCQSLVMFCDSPYKRTPVLPTDSDNFNIQNGLTLMSPYYYLHILIYILTACLPVNVCSELEDIISNVFKSSA